MGLLLLRAAIGIVVLIQSGFYLGGGFRSVSQTWMAVLSITAGGALLAGLFTPIAALVTGLGAVGIAVSFLPPPSALNLADSKLAVIFIAIVAAAIVCLGPGAFSADARLFGRREIIIPRRPES